LRGPVGVPVDVAPIFAGMGHSLFLYATRAGAEPVTKSNLTDPPDPLVSAILVLDRRLPVFKFWLVPGPVQCLSDPAVDVRGVNTPLVVARKKDPSAVRAGLPDLRQDLVVCVILGNAVNILDVRVATGPCHLHPVPEMDHTIRLGLCDLTAKPVDGLSVMQRCVNTREREKRDVCGPHSSVPFKRTQTSTQPLKGVLLCNIHDVFSAARISTKAEKLDLVL